MKPDASKSPPFTGTQISQRLIRKLIQFSCRYISFNLSIPLRGIKFRKPVAERNQFLGGELLDFTLNSFNLSHYRPQKFATRQT